MSALLVVALLVAAPELPDYLKLPAAADINANSVIVERFGEAAIQLERAENKRGRHVALNFAMAPGSGDDAQGYWAPVRAALRVAGWSVVREDFEASPPFATLRYRRGKTDAWATFRLHGRSDVRLNLIEVGALKTTVALKPLTDKPEPSDDTQGWPWFVLPGVGHFTQTTGDDGPLLVQLAKDEEPSLISEHATAKLYSGFDGVSSLELSIVYRAAFAKAGWTVVHATEGGNQTELVIDAHYGKGARNVWASLRFTGELSVRVADLGAEDWSHALEKSCRFKLPGVNFAFGKAELRSDVVPELQKALALLTNNPASTFEIEGHTDNIGDEAFNQKLSAARATAVMNWFVAHKVAAARLSARGLGQAKPVADNATELGRAKNRRIELRRLDCTGK